LGYTDDVSILSFGDGHASFGCCEAPDQSVGVDNSKAQIYRTYQAQNSKAATFTVSLVAGYAYPINIWYANIQQVSTFSYTYTGPDGVTHSDWTGFAYSSYSLAQEATCYVVNAVETTSLWTVITQSLSK